MYTRKQVQGAGRVTLQVDWANDYFKALLQAIITPLRTTTQLLQAQDTSPCLTQRLRCLLMLRRCLTNYYCTSLHNNQRKRNFVNLYGRRNQCANLIIATCYALRSSYYKSNYDAGLFCPTSEQAFKTSTMQAPCKHMCFNPKEDQRNPFHCQTGNRGEL